MKPSTRTAPRRLIARVMLVSAAAAVVAAPIAVSAQTTRTTGTRPGATAPRTTTSRTTGTRTPINRPGATTAAARAAAARDAARAQATTPAPATPAPAPAPGAVQILPGQTGGNNVFRPTARINDEILTATDVEQRVALVRLANRGVIPDDQLAGVRQEVFQTLVDEILKIQEARANDITVPQADVDAEFARIAASQRLTPAQFTRNLAQAGSSATTLKQQIRGDMAWQRLLARNIQPFTNVSEEEVRGRLTQLEAQRGAVEYRVGEIYLPATPETLQATAETARRMMQALAQGANFQELATRNSRASSAAAGGDLGWVRLDQLPATMASALGEMQPGQLNGPIEVPGGVSVLLLIDKRQVLTADPRDAVLSLKQITLSFPAGTPEPRAAELANNFIARTRTINGCGQADAVAQSLGAEVRSQDSVAVRSLPAPLQTALTQLQVGQVTQAFGSPQTGVSVLVLCGREAPQSAATPSAEQLADRLREERIQLRATRYLRDIRRDAVIEYR